MTDSQDIRHNNAPPLLQTTAAADAIEIADLQDELQLECHQVDAGRFTGSLTRLTLGDARIVNETHDRGLHKHGHMPAGQCAISVLLEPSPQAWFMHHGADGDSPLFLLAGDTEFDLYVPGGMETLYLALDQADLIRDARQLDPQAWEHPPEGLACLGSTARRGFIQALRTAQHLARQLPEIEAAVLHQGLQQEITLLLGQAATVRSRPLRAHRQRARKLRILREARAYIDDCLDRQHSPGIVEICAQLGVCERSLQYSFRDLLQLTPVAYLRGRRLHRARRDLLATPPGTATVTAIALRYGFLHLGKFAQDYRRQFGERPSTTLVRLPR